MALPRVDQSDDAVVDFDAPKSVDTWADVLYRPAFPPAWAVPVAAATLHDAVSPAADLPVGAPRLVETHGLYRQVEPGFETPEGPHWYARVSPGSIRLGAYDPARAARRLEREHRHHRNRVTEGVAHMHAVALHAAVAALAGVGLVDVARYATTLSVDPLAPGKGRSRIVSWSAKSRSHMIERLSTLDYQPLVDQGVPAMVTLTLPSDWLAYAPTGEAWKRLIGLFVKSYERSWERRLRCLWKLEFQRRGAPHQHFLMAPPTGYALCRGRRGSCGRTGLSYCTPACRRSWRQWFAETWADVLDIPDAATRDAVVAVHHHRSASADYAEGLRASDPKRVAVYFLKHSLLADKEYQHVVPEAWTEPAAGPGRFWGYMGLARADEAVPLTYEQAVYMARTLRRWDASKRGTRRVSVPRASRVTGEVRYRTVRRRVGRMPRTAGFMIVNDGPAATLMLADLVRRM